MASTLWTSFFKNGVPAPTLDSHGKEEGLCHIRPALGAALGEVETNMMGNGRMASPPLAEGGEPIAVPEKWTFIVGHLDAPTELDLSPCSESAAKLRDPRQLVWTASFAHLYVTLPRRLRRRRTRVVGVSALVGPLVHALAAGAHGIGNGMHPRSGTTLRSIVRSGYVPPHTLHTLRSWFLLLYW